MLTISNKRIISLEAHLPSSLKGKSLYVGNQTQNLSEQEILRSGLSSPFITGETVLPSVIGPATRFNAKGKEIPLKHQPKETLYRDMEFTRTEWRGKDRVEVTGCVWIPYQRYPRKIVQPPGIELQMSKLNDGTQGIVSGPFVYGNKASDALLLSAINVHLELFGNCSIFDSNAQPIKLHKVIRVNWQLLPRGKMPWNSLRDHLEKAINLRPKSKAAALSRFEQINTLDPDFTAVGNAGFHGYVVFGFNKKNLFVLESQYVNNAIYVFGKDWATLSQMTKAQILDSKSHVGRIIHKPDWFKKLSHLLQ